MAGLRAQLQLKERRWLLMVGDVLSVIISVLIALRIWAFVGRIHFSLAFIGQQFFWFPLFISLWVLLANANDFYDLRIVQVFAGHRSSASTEAYRQTGLEELKASINKHHPLQ